MTASKQPMIRRVSIQESRRAIASECLKNLFARGGGEVSWEDFIRAALYDPACGYYSSTIRGVGPRCDFTTAPGLSPLVGRAVARRAKRFLDHLPAGPRPGFIEIGAGEGLLMDSALNNLGILPRRRWCPLIVETSKPLCALQRKRLRFRIDGWYLTPQEALRHCAGRAFFFANELVDAFPPVIAEYRDGRWGEIAVSLRSPGGLAEVWREPGERCVEALRSSSVARIIEQRGQAGVPLRAEIHFSFKEWLSALASKAKHTEILLIDYGYEAPELLAAAPRGSLRAYYFHQRFTGIEVARRFGLQDITCDVNFTDLREWARHLGFHSESLGSLAGFLRANLTDAEIARGTPAEGRLLDEQDAGGRFQVFSLLAAQP